MYQDYDLENNTISRIWFSGDLVNILQKMGFSYAPKGLIGVNLRENKVIVQSRGKTIEMKAGKFMLKAGFGDAASRAFSESISAQSALMSGAELQMTTNGEESYDVYNDGPNSCMSGDSSVRAYDGVDVAVAYVEVEDRIIARAVVNLNDQKYLTIYGNSSVLKPLLLEQGFVFGGLEGCTIDLLEGGNGYLCPYIDDGAVNADILGDRLLLTKNGFYHVQNTSGTLEDTYTCEECDASVHEDEGMFDEHREMTLCESCYDDCHVYVDGSNYHIESDEIVCLHNGDYAIMDEAIFSEYDNEYYHCDDVTYVEHIECYYPNDEVVDALCDPEELGDDVRALDNCTKFDGEWVCDEYLEDYKALLAEEEE